jgi:hypothetical protein
MKLRDLERHLRGQGCIFLREGGAHTVWLNPYLKMWGRHLVCRFGRHPAA